MISNDEITQALDHLSPVRRGDLYRSHVPAILAELARVTKERDGYLANLTAVQQRCTELKQATRDQSHLDALTDRIALARAKHPGGPNLRSLVEEVGDVASAIRREPHRVRDELLDVACVAMRLVLGEGTIA